MRLKDGRRFAADLVASNADVVHTYGTLLGGTARGDREARRLKGKRFSMSLFVIYFGLKTHRPEHPVTTPSCFGRRYRELIAEIFKGGHTLPGDFSLYLHNPCVDRPLARAAGRGQLLRPLAGAASRQRRHRLGDRRGRATATASSTIWRPATIPNLRADLVTSRIFTPHDFRDELNAHLGSAFSLDPVLTQSAWFRPHNRDAEIANLYLVGAGTHPGAGVPGVVGSAKATAGLMIADARA